MPKSTSESQAQITYLLTAPEPAWGTCVNNLPKVVTWQQNGPEFLHTLANKQTNKQQQKRMTKMYTGHNASACICVSVPSHIPTLLHRPGCNLGEW